MYYVTGINRLISYIRSIFKKTFCKHTWKLLYTYSRKYYDDGEDYEFYECTECHLYNKIVEYYSWDGREYINNYYYGDKEYLRIYALELTS